MVSEARRAAGVFYTPDAAARFVVAETLAPLVAGRSAEDLARLRILDPACGEGVFLRAALDELCRAGGERHRARLARECLFGVDLDARAVEVARRALGGEARIVRGNAVVGADHASLGLGRALERRLASRAPFDFETLQKGGFDAVLGNPPYVRPHRIDAAEKAYFKKTFATFRKKSDLFVCFMERAARLLLPGGRLGLLTSRSWLTHDSFQALREFLLDELACESLVECPDDLFPDANVRTVILVGKRRIANENANASVNENANASVKIGVLSASGVDWRGAVEPAAFRRSYKSAFDLSLADARVAAARAHVAARARPLGESFTVCFGLKTGDDAKWLHARRLHARDRPLVTGEDVARFRVAGARLHVCYAPAAMRAHRATARPGDAARFERDKLLVKDTATRLAAAFDAERRYAKDVLIVLPKEDAQHSLHYLCGVLNSRLMDFFYRGTFNAVHVQKHELESLPVLIFDRPDFAARIESLALKLQRAPDADAERALDEAVYALYE
ncbi:MAG TPA: TaqI-like C-terminal specificity domain-containing protein, partial [Polyangia bacterium]|nr:TaqI-like C-terminal specificity domain-containing protein [Polyangia bacterium]